MTYWKRIGAAAAIAILINGALWLMLGRELGRAALARADSVRDEVLMLDLTEPDSVDESLIRRLVETAVPAEAPVEESDYISDQDSQARDMNEDVGEDGQPRTEEPKDVDQIARAASAESQPAATPPARQLEEETSIANESVEQMKESAPDNESSIEVQASSLSEESTVEEETLAESEASDEERVLVAKNEEAAPGEFDAPEAAREAKGAQAQGYTNFEAKSDEFAPYMLEIRKRVERHWRTALHLKYSGTGRTSAELECAIKPSGEIAYVRVMDSGNSLSHAALCKEAIEKAGPFPPFPFEVPELYRKENLEIRWRFSFM